MAMGECLVYSSRLRGQVCSFAYELASSWRWPTFSPRTQSELSHMASRCRW